MTQKQVQDALFSVLEPVLAGPYPALVTTASRETARQLYSLGVPYLACTPRESRDSALGTQTDWTFLLQCSVSLQPAAQATTEIAAAADRDLVDRLRESINDNLATNFGGGSGYAALRAAGLYNAACKGLEGDGGQEGYMNPLLFTCSTIRES